MIEPGFSSQNQIPSPDKKFDRHYRSIVAESMPDTTQRTMKDDEKTPQSHTTAE